MTLISTAICKYGIIQASDSHLTGSTGEVTAGPKVFRLGFCQGALSLAGTYGVGAAPMNEWMSAFVSSYGKSPNPSIGDFANRLADEIGASSTANSPRLFHIAGYKDESNGTHPEFYFVRNIQGINPVTGTYEGVTGNYLVTEDFWTRDYAKAPSGMFAIGGSQRYFNGYPEGRIAYLGAMRRFREFYEQVWSEPGWKFRKPNSLDELVEFVTLELQAVNALFTSSDYPAPYIGGEIQIEKIYAPPEAIDL
ncbi:hypothetical protein QQY66_23320 [Streptomyces sp. DG2A-72]|uniref:hypothetical protein n=1 Tax=Streptomyces sp. DG2A-72 TaxID=3051386 RepID=UPI00265B8E3D|nr:hypothetical protein [Streptomyces sp. DG2A-72]MDO0934463.1 hypothetical protein [Streptomyces sp. DG2A-72]